MRAKKNDLHQLIRNLNTTELRNVKAILKEKHDRQARPLFKMFNLMHQQEEYDEDQLKKALPKSERKRYLVHWKYELTEIVFETLEYIHKKHSAKSQLYQLLDRAEILREKQLSEQSNLMLDRAEAIAQKFEYHNLELEINKMRRLILSETYPKNPMQVIQQQISRKNATLLKLGNEYQYRDVSNQVFMMLRQFHSVQDKRLINDMTELMEQDFMQNEKQAVSVNARLAFHYSHYRFQKMLGKHKTAHYHISEVVNLWNLHPHRKEEYPLYYRQTIVNLCNSYFRLKKFDEIEGLIKEAKKYTGKSIMEKASYFQEIALIEFLLYMNTGKLKDALDFADRSMDDLRKFSHLIQNSHRITMTINIATIYFLTDQPRKALRALNGVITEKCEERKDIQEYSLIFQLILLHMTGEYDTLESQLRSSNRSIGSRSNFKILERFIIKQLKALLQLNKAGFPSFFKNFLEEFHQLKKDEKISSLGFEEICLWAQAHIERKGVQEVFLQQLQNTGKE